MRESAIRQAFAALAGQSIDAPHISAAPEMVPHGRLAADLALTAQMPSITFQRDHADDGALMAYGPSFTGMFRGLADYVDRVLRGADPAEMPIAQPATFEFVVNLRPPPRSASPRRRRS